LGKIFFTDFSSGKKDIFQNMKDLPLHFEKKRL